MRSLGWAPMQYGWRPYKMGYLDTGRCEDCSQAVTSQRVTRSQERGLNTSSSQKEPARGLPWWFRGLASALPVLGARAQPLVRELRPHMAQFRVRMHARLRTLSLSHSPLFVTPWTVARQAPLSMGLSWQKYWHGLPFPPPEDLPDSGIKPMSLVSPALAGRFSTTESPGKPEFSCSN